MIVLSQLLLLLLSAANTFASEAALSSEPRQLMATDGDLTSVLLTTDFNNVLTKHKVLTYFCRIYITILN